VAPEVGAAPDVDAASVVEAGVDPVVEAGVDPVVEAGVDPVVDALGFAVVPVVNRTPVDPVVAAGQLEVTWKGVETAAKFRYPFL